MPLRAFLVWLVVLLFAPAVASASLADVQRDGRELAAQLQHVGTTCDDLSTEDFDHIGEYVMGRVVGSTRAHQAMNDRMRLMMGDPAEERMHRVMGRRFTGCFDHSADKATSGMGAAMMGGGGMMGGAAGVGRWSGMMRSGDWNWMSGSAWRTMTGRDWQRLERRWLAPRATDNDGRRPWRVIAVGLGAIALAALGALVFRRPLKPPPAHPSPS